MTALKQTSLLFARLFPFSCNEGDKSEEFTSELIENTKRVTVCMLTIDFHHFTDTSYNKPMSLYLPKNGNRFDQTTNWQINQPL